MVISVKPGNPSWNPDQYLRFSDQRLRPALELLGRQDSRPAEVARLRIFAGLSSEDVAAALDLTPRTIERDWLYARARLAEMLGPPGAGPAPS